MGILDEASGNIGGLIPNILQQSPLAALAVAIVQSSAVAICAYIVIAEVIQPLPHKRIASRRWV